MAHTIVVDDDESESQPLEYDGDDVVAERAGARCRVSQVPETAQT